ncbi:hypothetical protein E2562_035041 [Oryza meyeriana var. granulata]|uniref:Uncharacterized protein n=1 Tax=Oryza meyeriana var. granulata TaxID=110450 RepID=A0A6G1ECX4_9ORYZ|nr:hypothetical protein E2562_035041 [Oryza meyeriana var. granulata]
MVVTTTTGSVLVTSPTTASSTGSSTPVPAPRLHLGTTQDSAGQHSHLPKDRCTHGPVPAGDGICQVLGTGVGIDSKGDLLDPSRHCTTYYLYHGSHDYSCIRICTDVGRLWPCGALLNEPGHHGGAHWALIYETNRKRKAAAFQNK